MRSPDNVLKSRGITLLTKVHRVKNIVFPVVTWELLDHKEVWVWNNWCFWTVVLEKTLESPLNSKELQPVNPKGNQNWILIGRTDAEAEAPILWPPDAKSWDAGRDWGQEEKGTREDEMVGWHHRLNGREFEQAPGYGEGQGSLWNCSPRSQRVKHDWATEQPQINAGAKLKAPFNVGR